MSLTTQNELQQALSQLNVKRYLLPVLGIAVVGIGVFGSYFTVDAGDKGIIRRFGETIRTVDPGLGFKFPIVDDLITISIREQKLQYGGFDHQGDLTHGFSAYSKDQQTVTAGLTVTYNVIDPIKVYDTFRTVDNMVAQIIEPRLRNQLEITLSKYSAKEAVEKRAELAQVLEQNIRDALKGYPVNIAGIQPVIQFNEEYERQIEESVKKNVELETAQRQKLIAEKQAETLKVNAQAQADAQIIHARAEAEKLKLAADAEAHAIKVQGEAEAQALKAKNEALKDNQQLAVLKAAERWDGKLPVYMMPNSAMPFLQIPQKSEK